ncbi:MAG: hypothetical protein AB7U83_14670 [Vicinamibacterales bacterium]
MSTRRAFLATLAGLAAIFPTFAVAQPPVAGRWTLTVDSPQGTTSATLVLAVDGAALKGSISSDMGETPISGGTVSGADVRFQFDYAGPSGPITIITTGTVAGDEIKGDMDYGQGTAPFTGKRAN